MIAQDRLGKCRFDVSYKSNYVNQDKRPQEVFEIPLEKCPRKTAFSGAFSGVLKVVELELFLERSFPVLNKQFFGRFAAAAGDVLVHHAVGYPLMLRSFRGGLARHCQRWLHGGEWVAWALVLHHVGEAGHILPPSPIYLAGASTTCQQVMVAVLRPST